MKYIRTKTHNQKIVERKIIVNEKSIPKGCYCYNIKTDSERMVWFDQIKDVAVEVKMKICPFLKTMGLNEFGDEEEFCSLLKLGIENGEKICKYNNTFTFKKSIYEPLEEEYDDRNLF